MILSTLDKSRKGGAYEQIPSLVLGQRWTPQLNSRNMMKVVLCVWIEPYIENDLSFCVWPVHTPTTSKEVLTLSASTSPLPYTGNKSCIVNTILSVMPKHTVYIDPCMGSAEVFFRKPRAEKEIQNVSVEDVGSFENLEDAYAAGYRLCRHCSPIAKLYRKESDVLQGYCQSHAASVFFKDRFIGISTPISDWRIIPSGKGNEVVLYHKNTLGDKKTGPVPRYHLQWVSQNTISGYLEYISDHDLYRNMHPLYPVQSKKNSPPPMKGTKRYRKEQKRAAKKARRQSIAHVLTLIENLDTQARVARSM